MEDELEDRVFYQTYMSHARLLSKASLGAGVGVRPAAHLWRLTRLYLLRYEAVVLALGIVAVVLYLRLHVKIGFAGSTRPSASARHKEWDGRGKTAAAYALQGRRPHMEDRFALEEDLRQTGVSLFAIFDGHGGEFAADYARDRLVEALADRIAKVKDVAAGKAVEEPPEPVESKPVERKKSFKSAADDAAHNAKKDITDPELLGKLLNRPITREVPPTSAPRPAVRRTPLADYVDGGKIDFGRLIADEVLAADRLLVEKAKKTMDVAGTTALIAVLENDLLTVANVGDSRGVMCDSKGNAIPLSFDHKPQQMREQKRIKEAGGYIAFNGVWRVAGILATSRAMGDYPLKDKRYVIADPDVLTFDLADHRPPFVVLATDGLWDTFTNEEAVAFLKDRLDEPDHGAKSLTLQSYDRGSVDNITVMVIDLRDRQYAASPKSRAL